MVGEAVNKELCLFIDKESIPNAEAFFAQLAQVTYKENESGRLVIDKDPNKTGSPDMFDALCLAFAADSRFGLRIRPDRVNPNMLTRQR